MALIEPLADLIGDVVDAAEWRRVASDNPVTEDELMQLREDTDRTTRYLEDLELAREHSVLLQQELPAHPRQQYNDRIYVLSVVAAIFLPVTSATGLPGVYVGGLPGLDSPMGFGTPVAIMVGLGGVLYWYFKWKKWV